MADDKKKSELRIIDEFDDEREIAPLPTEDSQDSETQLPRKKASLRRSAEKQAIVRDLEEASSDAALSKDLDEEALTAAAPSPIHIPPAFFVIVALIFLSLLGIGIFLATGGRDRKTNESLRAQIRSNIELAEEEKKSAQNMVHRLLEAIENYSSADSINEKLAYARQPERVKALMEDYYATREMKVHTGARLVSQHALPLSSRSFVMLTAAFDDDSQKVLLAEVANDLSVRIDWESDVCYQSVDLTKYIATRSTETVILRVLAQPDNFYVYEFADNAKYQCFQLNFRDSDEILYGYVEKGSLTSTRLNNHFELARQMTSSSFEPMTIEVRFLEGGRSERGVFIEKFIAPRWANIDEFEE